MLKRAFAALLIALLPATSWAQVTVLQGGSWSPGLVPMYSASGGSQPYVQNSGTAGGGTGLSELNITARGSGTAPFNGQGTGPSGTVSCIKDGPVSGPYHYLCMSAQAGGAGLITYGAANGASTQQLNFTVNGTTYQFPFTSGAVIGPGSSTVNDVACWNNTAGTLLKDCGTQLTIGGSSGQVQYNNGGNLGGFTVGGDGTLNTGTGALTISKIGGQVVSLGGALTTSNAFTTAGAFPMTLTAVGSTSVTLPQTGTLATLAGNEALTNKSVNGLTITPSTGTLTITNAKTLAASNTLTFAGADGSTLNIGTGGTLGTAAFTAASAYVPSGTQITNSLSANVNLSSGLTYFDGPAVAQGSTGTWCASGTVTLLTGGGADSYKAKLWDGTTVIASAETGITAGGAVGAVSLSGCLSTPAGNIRISIEPNGRTDGTMLFNGSGNSKDSTITAWRTQ